MYVGMGIWPFLYIGGPFKGGYRAPLKGFGVDVRQVINMAVFRTWGSLVCVSL